MSKFRIQGVGLDTTHLEYQPGEDFEFDYLFTSIRANNENVVRGYSNYAPLVTYIDFLDKADEAVISHLELLGRNMVDLLLVDAKCDIKEYAPTLSSLVDGGIVDVIGIYGPTSVDQVKEIEELLPDLKYIGLELCPYNFDHDLVSYILESEKEIVGFNPFGGYIHSAEMISTFTVPYLLGFASNYSTLLFLSGRDIFTAANDRDYIGELVDTEASEIYNLDQTIKEEEKEIKQGVGVSIKLDPNHTLPLVDPEAIFSPSDLSITLGEAENDTKDFDIELGSIEDLVYDYYDEFKIPHDTDDDRNILALIKPRIMGLIKKDYPEISGWNLEWNKIGDKIIIISLVRSVIRGKWIFKRQTKVAYKNYLLAVNSKSLEFCALDTNSEMVQSADPEDSNS